MTARAQTRARRRILIVENCDILRTFLALALQGAGYDVTIAADAAEARAALAEPIEVALLDVVLPGDTGGSLAGLFSARSIPVIVMSGNAKYIENAHALGYPFLAKPFRIAALTTMLDAAVAGAGGAPEAAISEA